MSDPPHADDPPRPSWWRRATGLSVAALAVLAYLPALTAAPGRMPADSKLYLYLDPARFLGDAASTFDPRQFAGWVPHQHVSYLWPAGPWFWLFERVGVPDWIAHRLWIGSLMLAAGLGVRWCARLLGLGQIAALVAATVYQLSPYVLPYVSRTSVMLLPWAGLGWIVGCTVRATRRASATAWSSRWGDPAAIALLVFTVGSVNATALAMIVPAPLLWLVHAAWQRTMTWRQAIGITLRVVALTVPVCLWWIVMLVIQGRFGAEVLPYSESLADVSLTSTGPEVWRSLGYWLFYVRDGYASTTTESLRYLVSTWSIAISYLVPIVCLTGLVWVRWAHRRFAGLLVAVGALLAVGVHPIDDRSPLMRVLAGDDESGLALALRSSTRALPVMNLGMALLAGSFVAACSGVRLGVPRWRADYVAGSVVIAVAVLNLPSLWTGAFVDPALERDQDPPDAWTEAASIMNAGSTSGRVLQVPGAEFGAFRWGYTVDQPLPGLTEKPLVTRDLLPLGSAGAMDLLYALDDRIQDGVFEPASLAPMARWLGVDTIWVANDLAFDRFRTARPQTLTQQVAGAPGVGEGRSIGPVAVNQPRVPMTDEHALGNPFATAPTAPVDLYPVEPAGTVVRAKDRSVVVSGSGDGLVDLAAAGVLDGSELVRYSASLTGDELTEAVDEAAVVLVTDSNRSRARHWRSSQDATGYTESDQPGLGLLRDVASDARLPVFAERDEAVDPATQTVARQVGPVTATATAYGEPFAYLPEHRPFMAIDGDPETAWIVGRLGDPIGETLRLHFDEPQYSVTLVQSRQPGARVISSVTIRDVHGSTPPSRVVLAGAMVPTPPSVTVDLPSGATDVDITIEAVTGGIQGRTGELAGVGFSEIVTGQPPTVEVVRVPTDALGVIDADTPFAVSLTRQRVDPMDRWRDDPEPRIVREVVLPSARELAGYVEVRVDRRTSDEALAGLFGWPAWATSRLTGSVANAGVAAIDGDPATAWITAFEQAQAAILTIDGATEPVSSITLRQPVGEFSPIVELMVRSGGDQRVAPVEADADGMASISFDPPLAPGRIEIGIAGIEPHDTPDRRFGSLAQLPAAIAEIEFAGRPATSGVADSAASVACTPLLNVDGVSTSWNYAFEVSGQQAILGEAVVAEPCQPAVALEQGTHMFESLALELPIQVDRVVLSDRLTEDQVAPANPTATVVDDGRFRRTIEVDGCDDGCWLVFGEGYNEAWTATGPEGSLDPPQLVDGGFNGWRIAPSSQPVEVVVEWTQQRTLHIAFAVSAVGVILALVLFVLDRRRRDPAPEPVAELPMLTGDLGPITPRRAIVLAVAWCALSAVLIAPTWALAGAAGGLVVVLLRRRRLVELTAWATVIAVGALVTIRERRNSPAPNGGWPTIFESWHRLAMFAVVTVFVAALFADDATRSAHDEKV